MKAVLALFLTLLIGISNTYASSQNGCKELLMRLNSGSARDYVSFVLHNGELPMAAHSSLFHLDSVIERSYENYLHNHSEASPQSLVDFHHQRLAAGFHFFETIYQEKLQEVLNANFASSEVIFNHEVYQRIGKLGQGLDARVYLLQKGNDFFVEKKFFNRPHPQSAHFYADDLSDQLYRLLHNGPVKTIQVLARNRQEHSLLLEYIPAVALRDIHQALSKGVVLPQQWELFERSFRFEHALNFNLTQIEFAGPVRAMTGDASFLRPSHNNMLFNPFTGEWVIIDPY